MNSRERLLTVLRGEMPDRVPVAPFVQEEYLSFYYPGRAAVDRVIDATELANELDFDLMAKHRGLEAPPFFRRDYAGWELRRSESRDDDMERQRLEIVTPARTFAKEDTRPLAGAATAGLSFTPTAPLLKSPEDIACFCELLPAPDEADRARIRETAQAWRAVLGQRGVLAPWGWAGVFNFACELCGMDNLYALPYEDEALYGRLMGRLADAMAVYAAAFAESGIDALGVQGHMAGATTVSPDFFGRFVLPYEKRVLDAIHAAGLFSVYHNCGCARALYPQYRELGMSVWETVAEPPRGDNRLAEAKAALGDRICLLGNLDQVYFLKRASPSEVDARTREIVRTGKPGGRFIFSTSDFLEKGTPRENVVAMIEAAKDEGRY